MKEQFKSGGHYDNNQRNHGSFHNAQFFEYVNTDMPKVEIYTDFRGRSRAVGSPKIEPSGKELHRAFEIEDCVTL